MCQIQGKGILQILFVKRQHCTQVFTLASVLLIVPFLFNCFLSLPFSFHFAHFHPFATNPHPKKPSTDVRSLCTSRASPPRPGPYSHPELPGPGLPTIALVQPRAHQARLPVCQSCRQAGYYYYRNKKDEASSRHFIFLIVTTRRALAPGKLPGWVRLSPGVWSPQPAGPSEGTVPAARRLRRRHTEGFISTLSPTGRFRRCHNTKGPGRKSGGPHGGDRGRQRLRGRR